MIQCFNSGQNPSFGSRDKVQTSFFGSKFDIQSAGVTFKTRNEYGPATSSKLGA